MRSLRSRVRHPVCVYGKRGGSPCVFIPVLVARSLSPSPRSPLSQKRPRLFRLVRVAPRLGGGRAVRARGAPPWLFYAYRVA